LLPSFYEGSSNALIEACGAGLPVIVSDISSNSEVVVDNVNGFLLPVDNPQKWAEKISELLNNQEILEIFSANSRVKAINSFSMNVNREKLKKLVDGLSE
jgi:glycosyltransferase involved in cell wall biosynthesis